MASVTPQQLYSALLGAGASPAAAAGIVGNAEFEVGGLNANSSLELGHYTGDCMGFVCWTRPYYNPPAPTGDAQKDLDAQVAYLAQNGLGAATGGDAVTAARNFAANFEKCQGCQPGGYQWTQRGIVAGQIAQMAAAGNWGPAGGGAPPAGGNGSSATGQPGIFGIFKAIFGADPIEVGIRAIEIGGGALIFASGLVLLALTVMGGGRALGAAAMVTPIGRAGELGGALVRSLGSSVGKTGIAKGAARSTARGQSARLAQIRRGQGVPNLSS